VSALLRVLGGCRRLRPVAEHLVVVVVPTDDVGNLPGYNAGDGKTRSKFGDAVDEGRVGRSGHGDLVSCEPNEPHR
jgi:hypothetical protein